MGQKNAITDGNLSATDGNLLINWKKGRGKNWKKT